jgi:hypothetical protein
MSSSTVVTASDWTKGISLSVLASMIGGASKLAIRKSWILEQELERIRTFGEHEAAEDYAGELHPGRDDAMDRNDADSILVTAVSTLSQEDDNEDEPLEQPRNAAHATDNGEDGAGHHEQLVEMSANHHIRRHSMSSRAAAATGADAVRMSSGSSTSSLRQRLSLLVSRKTSHGNANRSFDIGEPDSLMGASSSPYVRAPNSDPARRRRSHEADAPFDSSLSARRLSFAEGRPDPLSIPSFASGRIDNNNISNSNHSAPLERGNDDPSRSELTSRRRRSSASSRNPRRGSSSSGSAEQRGCCQSRVWICALRGSGMVGMTFLNPLCGVLAMNFASPSILAPFSGLTLVWIILFSEALIGERPTPMQVVAALMIVLGEVVVALYGDHTNDSGISVEEVVTFPLICCLSRALALRVGLISQL